MAPHLPRKLCAVSSSLQHLGYVGSVQIFMTVRRSVHVKGYVASKNAVRKQCVVSII